MYADNIPEKGIRRVSTLGALFSESFDREHNVVLLPGTGARALSGDFNGLAAALGVNGKDFMSSMDFISNALSPHAYAFTGEVQRIMADAHAIARADLVPTLYIIPGTADYDDAPHKVFITTRTKEPIAMMKSDTHQFHVDTGNNATGRLITCYTGPATEGLEVGRSIAASAMPGIRRKMRDTFAQQSGTRLDLDSERLTKFIEKNRNLRAIRFPAKGARPFAFAPGDMWIQAVEANRDITEPFAHRAPHAPVGGPPRLLLAADRGKP